jgi:excisionase family DNA binding protein
MQSTGLISLAQVALRLGVSGQTIRNMIEAGEIPAIRVRGQWRFEPQDIEDYLSRNTSGTRAKGSRKAVAA